MFLLPTTTVFKSSSYSQLKYHKANPIFKNHRILLSNT